MNHAKAPVRSTPEPSSLKRWLRGALLGGLCFAAPLSVQADVRTISVGSPPAALATVISDLNAADTPIDEMTVGLDDRWIIVADGVVYSSANADAAMVGRVHYVLSQGYTLEAIAIAPDGDWAIISDGYMSIGAGVAERAALISTINAWRSIGRPIEELALTEDGWALAGDGTYAAAALPPKLTAALSDRVTGQREIDLISYRGDDRWLMVADQSIVTEGTLGTGVNFALQTFQINAFNIDHVALTAGGSAVVFSNDDVPPPANAMESIEYGLPGGKNIWQRMAETGTPGLSLAVIEDDPDPMVDQPELAYSRGYGVLTAGTEDFVRVSSPFDAASLSKMVGSVVTLMATDATPGTTIDTPIVNLATALTSTSIGWWNMLLTNSPAVYGVSAVPLSNLVTLRRALSHTAGLTDQSSTAFTDDTLVPGLGSLSGLVGYQPDGAGGYTVNTGNPNTDQSVWMHFAPQPFDPVNQQWSYEYTGAGFLLASAVAEAITGYTDFNALATDTLFAPLNMPDAHFGIYYPTEMMDRAASMHDSTGAVVERNYYTWYSAGGLYVTPRDYAQVMMLLLNRGVSSGGLPLVNPGTIATLLTDQVANGANYGLGVGLSGAPSEVSLNGFFRHTGSHPGESYSAMAGHPERNEGVVVMANAGNPWPETADDPEDLVKEVRATFCTVYGWPVGC